MKHIILCADDYGQNTSISQAIIELLEKKRLSATSCMVTSSDWIAHAKWLQPFQNQADIGLHFNLTEGKPLSSAYKLAYGTEFMSLLQLLKKAYLSKLDVTAIEAECHAQLDRFEEGMGCLPDFMDGHQHIHQFPMIRDAFLTVYEQRLRQKNSYVRCVYDDWALLRIFEPAYIKKLIIQLCGASVLKKQLSQRSIPYNASFSGIYQFAQASKYGQLFPRFLQQMHNNGVIMCHPGLPGQQDRDPIALSRPHEYRYFLSEQFLKDCFSQQAVLARFNK